MAKVILIVNPVSGNGRSLELAPKVYDRMVASGHSVEKHISESIEHTRSLAASAQSGDIVAVLGGDGTVSVAQQGLISDEIPILVLPVGTANVIARELLMPLNAVNASEVLNNGTVEKWDLGYWDNNAIIFSLSAGFDAETVRRLSAARSGTISSRLAYIRPAVETFMQFEAKPIRIEVDGIPLEGEFSYFLAINTKRYAGGFIIDPAADPTDGRFNLIALRSFDFLSYIRYGLAAALGRITKAGDAYVTTFKTLKAESSDPVPVQVDGEARGYLPVSIELSKRKCAFLRPKNKGGADECCSK